MRIDIGGGKNPKKYFLSVDINPAADFIVDLEKGKLPFEDESIDEIYSQHTFEHIKNIIPLMNECWRVLKPNSLMEVVVPYYKCCVAFQDPTHVRFWTEESMKYYDGKYLKKYDLDYGIECEFEVLNVEVSAPDGRPNYLTEIKYLLRKGGRR